MNAEVEKQLQEGGGHGIGSHMSVKKSSVGGPVSSIAVSETRAVQMRRPTNRRGKQAPTPPKRTRSHTFYSFHITFT